jgi:CHAT domain-containing protein
MLAPPHSTNPFSMRRFPSVLVAGCGIACAAALVAGFWPGRVGRSSSAEAERQALVAASGVRRHFEPRLAGGFPHAPVSVQRGASLNPAPPDVRIIAATIEKRIGPESSAATLAVYGAAQVLAGNAAEAIVTLSDAAALDGDSALSWNDLAAAYLIDAAAGAGAAGAVIDGAAAGATAGKSRRFVQALDAAARAARLQPTLREAWFNRALAAEHVLPPPAAAAAWEEYLRVDAGSAWAAEARSHRERLSSVTLDAPLDPRDIDAALVSPFPAALAAHVRSHPQRLREYVQDELLPAWGIAVEERNAVEARVRLDRISTLASLLSGANGDELLSRTIARLHDLSRVEPVTGRGVQAAAAGHRAYGRAVRAYAQEKREEAESEFARAREAFAAAGSPFVGWADVQLAVTAYRRRDLAEAARRLDAVQRDAAEKKSQALLARVRWMRAFLATQNNQIDRALAEYQAAAGLYRALGERENELALYTAVSDNLRLFGDREAAWVHVSQTSTRSAAMRDPVRRYLAFYNAALLALEEDFVDAALLLQNSAVAAAKGAATPVALAEGLATRASIHGRLGQDEEARRDLESAAAAASALERGSRTYFDARLDAVKGQVLAERSPDEALAPLARAAAFFATAEPGQHGRLLLESGRLRLRLGRVDEARRDFDAGIANFEERSLGIRSRAMRVSYADQAWSLFDEAIELELRRRDDGQAFAYAERSRARTVAERLGADTVLTLEQVKQALPPDAAAAIFKATSTRLLCWVVTNRAARAIVLDLSPAALERRIRAYRRALMSLDESDTVRQLSSELYTTLIAALGLDPKVRTLAMVLDGPLHGVPFASLRDPRSGQFLVEQYSLVEAPSAGVLLRHAVTRVGNPAAPAVPERGGAQTSPLLIGAPALDQTVFATLPVLRGAEEEVRALAAMYPDARLLMGTAASKSRVLSSLAGHRLVHFAGHAIPNPQYPAFSLLALAPDPESGESGAVFAHEIEQLQLRGVDVVVLAACDTATGYLSLSEGPLSLARAFLAAGVPRVVASLWRVDDRETAALLRRFHEQLRAGRSPAHALREAQLHALKSSDVLLRRPAVWAAFSVFGAL